MVTLDVRIQTVKKESGYKYFIEFLQYGRRLSCTTSTRYYETMDEAYEAAYKRFNLNSKTVINNVKRG